MATFVQPPCSPSMGDPGRMSTASPMSGNIMPYQATPNQLTDSSFFDEAIDTSSVSIAWGLDISEQQPHCSAAPAQTTESKGLRDGGTLQDILPGAEGNDKPANRLRNRRQSRPCSAPSENSATAVVVESPKPRKCGRKLKKLSKGSDPTGQQEELDDDDLPKNPHRRRIPERNRIAATKCRLRKRDEASALASRERAIEDQNRYLSSCFDSLTTEIYYLKTEMLRHTDCNCVLIQAYIANEARKSVDSLLASSSALNAYGGSMSPEYVGSNGTSTTGSLTAQSPGAVSISPAWTTPLYQRPRTSEVRDGRLDMSLEPLPKAHMPHNSMAPVQTIPGVPLAGCVPGLYMNTRLQQQPADEMVWDSNWSFDYADHIVS
ncbi:hypothetical protein BGZ61DRAFT_147604 [Ilyonectria robusta]|uniref:uncharacterized protein n=1 Tax=Ilyonectria robusta TaxID=1079257 RepID=UPI001E8E8D7B|nr:uncharacterized protein BGZ61DRAFT_147604 [Ilyonectria robusta]KAH8661753.1 hypothetical protein BGZ61DRAFT_147604 [Ilyonectria robusta]